ncbi:MAG: hypothetical protein HY803_00520 [candidate division NC10 bacterium]|nr:hypothetical protein [candidate division NC10 bacterium]
MATAPVRRLRSQGRGKIRLRDWALILALGGTLGGTPGSGWTAERIFVQRLTSEPDSLDPAKSNRVQADQVMWLLYDALTQLSADGTEMQPGLAERWEQSADGLTTTFTLRRNVRFHDGTVLDAHAVKVSYERQFLPGSPFYATTPPNAYERVLAGLVKEVQVLDPLTVAITLHYPRPQQFALVKIVSPAALTRHGLHLTRTPVGTGPFRLERWEGDRIVLSPAPDSWHGRPRLDQVVFPIVADTQAAMTRLEAGEFDLVPEVPPHLFERLAANPLILPACARPSPEPWIGSAWPPSWDAAPCWRPAVPCRRPAWVTIRNSASRRMTSGAPAPSSERRVRGRASACASCITPRWSSGPRWCKPSDPTSARWGSPRNSCGPRTGRPSTRSGRRASTTCTSTAGP